MRLCECTSVLLYTYTTPYEQCYVCCHNLCKTGETTGFSSTLKYRAATGYTHKHSLTLMFTLKANNTTPATLSQD